MRARITRPKPLICSVVVATAILTMAVALGAQENARPVSEQLDSGTGIVDTGSRVAANDLLAPGQGAWQPDQERPARQTDVDAFQIQADQQPAESAQDRVFEAPATESTNTSSLERFKDQFQPQPTADRRASSRGIPARPASTTTIPPSALPKKPAGETDNKQVGTTDFTLAAQPKMGDHFAHDKPVVDQWAYQVDPEVNDFEPTPVNQQQPYDSAAQRLIYEGKTLNANRRPLIELGKPWYQLGQIKPAKTWLGKHNPVNEQFIVYGDYRMAYANAKNANRDYTSQVAFEWNMNLDLRLTGTERITAFVAPFDRNGNNSRWLLDDDDFIDELDFDIDFGMLEGDLGAIVGGFTGETLPFDLPFAAGVMPLLVQNGVWLEDAVTGVAFTLPARNSPRLDISNMDLTFFAAYDEIDSPAFEGNNSAARMYGFLSFIESFGGYWEIDYAYLEDRNRLRDRSYHNIGLAFSRRYGRFISNSVRVIINAGQSTEYGPNTADGVLLLVENSFITSKPSFFVPYFNFWAGFDRPQSAARNGNAGGILRNTGILFESDGMTGFPTLDATGNDTWGGAFGLNILTSELDQQLILEFAFLKTLGNDATRIAPGDQAGVGARYQLPLSNSWILRSDVMYGFFDNTSDVHGARVELRHKF